MYDDQPHPLLAQLPLTVSPYLSLPTTPTLPYTYKSLPTTLPPSSTAAPSSNPSESTTTTTPSQSATNTPPPAAPAFITSPTGAATTPAAIRAACTTLQTHLGRQPATAARALADWEAEIAARELAEKRRLAPGWLDRGERMLEPERVRAAAAEAAAGPEVGEMEGGAVEGKKKEKEGLSEGEELDRAFGALGVK